MEAVRLAKKEGRDPWAAMVAAAAAERQKEAELVIARCQEWCIAAVRLQREALKVSRWSYLEPGPLNDAAEKLAEAAMLLSTAAAAADREERIRRRALPESARVEPLQSDITIIRRGRRVKGPKERKG